MGFRGFRSTLPGNSSLLKKKKKTFLVLCWPNNMQSLGTLIFALYLKPDALSTFKYSQWSDLARSHTRAVSFDGYMSHKPNCGSSTDKRAKGDHFAYPTRRTRLDSFDGLIIFRNEKCHTDVMLLRTKSAGVTETYSVSQT